jgi:hypothetical protein
MSTKRSSSNFRYESNATKLVESLDFNSPFVVLTDASDREFLDAIYSAYQKSLGEAPLAEVHDCSICGTTFEGYGNNPAPVTSEGRACDSCNATKVIPARIARLDSGLTPNW